MAKKGGRATRHDPVPIRRTTIAELQGGDTPIEGRVFIKDAPQRLSEQQSRFVAAYLRNGGNATQAAIEAGYANNGNISSIATRVRWNPAVREALAVARQNVFDETCIDFKAKREFLWELANKAAKVEEEQEVNEHEEGGVLVRTIVVKQRLMNSRDAIDAIRELNMMDGDNKSGGSVGGNFNIEQALLVLKGGRS